MLIIYTRYIKLKFELFPGISKVKTSLKPTFRSVLLVFFKLFKKGPQYGRSFFIAGFHCYTIVKTIQQIKSKIKEIKEDEYSNSLAKVKVCAIFRAGEIYKDLYGDAMFVSLSGTQIWRPEANKNIYLRDLL